MQIGVVYFSHTGHTRQVGEAIHQKLTETGYSVRLMPLIPSEPFSLGANSAPLIQIPTIKLFDFLILGSPVYGGHIAGPMMTFLENTLSLDGIQLMLFVTHFFRCSWGAEQTLASFSAQCESKGGNVTRVIDIRCLFRCRRSSIIKASDQVTEGIHSYQNN